MKNYCPKCQSPSDWICPKCQGCEHCCGCTFSEERPFQHRSSREGVRLYRLALRELDKAKEQGQR